MNTPIRAPAFPVAGVRRFRITPRPKSAYFNVIKASELLDPLATNRFVRLEVTEGRSLPGPGLAFGFALEYPLASGRIVERARLCENGEGLGPVELERSVFNLAEQRVRYELVEFTDRTIPLPACTYPEVLLPFLLGWTPFDGRVRSVFAWITDRFMARVRFRSTGRHSVELESAKVETVEVVMYPDFNDWVRLGNVLSTLIGPFIPKYRMWYRAEPPHELVRFEGSYGPPGAPEVILEAVV
jgi:hypothetical protein